MPKYAVADLQNDGTAARTWARAEGASPADALRSYVRHAIQRDNEGLASGHGHRLRHEGTVRFLIGLVPPHGKAPGVAIFSIRFFDVTVVDEIPLRDRIQTVLAGSPEHVPAERLRAVLDEDNITVEAVDLS